MNNCYFIKYIVEELEEVDLDTDEIIEEFEDDESWQVQIIEVED